MPNEVLDAWRSFESSFPPYRVQVTFESKGVENIETEAKVRRVSSRDGAILQEWLASESLDESSPHALEAVGKNADYSFKVSRPSSADDFSLALVHWDGVPPNSLQRKLSMTPGVYGLRILGQSIPEAIRSGVLAVTDLSKHEGPAGDILKLQLSRTPSGQANGLRIESVQLELGEHVQWQILHAEAKLEIDGTTGRFTTHNTFATPDAIGRPVVTRMVGTESYEPPPGSVGGESFSLERSVRLEWRDEPPHKNDFRLSAFGLPEPVQPRSPRSLWVVLLLGAAATLALLAFFRYRWVGRGDTSPLNAS
ncbi:hypothetical protein [Roseimaritima sediminicola]|uniref:hypothetical protein n=1 Tax=Roseimaritima sediminicola TaxID=2662066 RepID=UPI0012984C6D|nr:hypothetical protein [Roseimaritima sediminicola]